MSIDKLRKGVFRFGYVDTVFFRFELETFEDLERRVESFVISELTSFVKGIEEVASTLPEEEKQDLYERYIDEHERLMVEFPNILRRSLLLALYSRFEHHLNEICEGLAREKKLAIHPTDLRDKGIVRSQSYFKKVIGLPFPDETPSWAHVLYVRGLRNRFAHAGGVCSNELRKRAEKDTHVILDEFDDIQLKQGFVAKTIDEMKTFSALIEKSLQENWKDDRDAT